MRCRRVNSESPSVAPTAPILPPIDRAVVPRSDDCHKACTIAEHRFAATARNDHPPGALMGAAASACRSVRPGQNARSPAACGAGPDASGIELLTIRSLAAQLGVQPMSVYHYVANKDEVLDGIVDVVLSEIDLPPGDGDWRADIRRRASSARREVD